ncbi:hypothetical protein ACFQFG_25275 [Methylobacterium persicinum]|uniref:Uncharacterized protein n=1 Tax=Methylobacterium persicinum TaxID=374426 RepID=A0ABU0HSQ0_9HYPH|nr:hypothetical protein [Methylobacterium persicinum]
MPDQITEKLDADKPPNKAAFAGCAHLIAAYDDLLFEVVTGPRS